MTDDETRTNRILWRAYAPAPRKARVVRVGGPLRGRLLADDIRDLARDLVKPDDRTIVSLLGDHENLAGGTSGAATLTGPLADALDTALKAMNGSGVFRSPKGRGVGAEAYRNEVARRTPRWTDGAARPTPCCGATCSPTRDPSPGNRRRRPSAAGAVAGRSARVAALAVEPVSAGGALGDRAHRSSRIGPRLSRCQRLHERRDAADRRAARARDAVDPPAVLGVQQRRRAGAHRAGSAHRRHDGRHDHALRARPRGADPAEGGDRGDRRLHRAIARAQVAATAGTRLHVIVTRDGSDRCCSAPAFPTPNSQGAVMIRMSEFVLPGHPDKFCDPVADAIVAECYKVDPRAYGQVEMASGPTRCSSPAASSRGSRSRATSPTSSSPPASHRLHRGQPHRRDRYQVRDTVCQRREDPRTWTDHVNDQCISIGWAGYDAKVDWLPPEHYLAHGFGGRCAQCQRGRLKGQGPDGKLLVRVRESTDDWKVEQVLVTLQQRPDISLLELTAPIVDDLRDAYAASARRIGDGRRRLRTSS